MLGPSVSYNMVPVLCVTLQHRHPVGKAPRWAGVESPSLKGQGLAYIPDVQPLGTQCMYLAKVTMTHCDPWDPSPYFAIW